VKHRRCQTRDSYWTGGRERLAFLTDYEDEHFGWGSRTGVFRVMYDLGRDMEHLTCLEGLWHLPLWL